MVTIFKEVLAKHGVPAQETQELLEIVARGCGGKREARTAAAA